MPIYAFVCTACDHAFDKLQKLSDPDPQTCPACNAQGTVQRQLTAPSFRLAGSGWYETDFKKDSDRKRNLAGEGAEAGKPTEPKSGDAKPDGSKSGDSKADASKPAAVKPESKGGTATKPKGDAKATSA